MTVPELVAAAIREVLRSYAYNPATGQRASAIHLASKIGPALDELARLFGIDMEKLIKEVS